MSPLFAPVLALMVLTLLVWMWMYVRRLGYIRQRQLDPQTLATPQKRDTVLPESVNLPAYNLRNLLELPVLFYALCLLLIAQGIHDALWVGLAWAFVALRSIHSAIHCTVNQVVLRFTAYALSSLVLWWMLGRAVLLVFSV